MHNGMLISDPIPISSSLAGELSKQLRLHKYKLFQCFDKQRKPCGCLQPLQQSPGFGHQCKVHGEYGDYGARALVQAFRQAGYRGNVFVQWPVLHGSASRGQHSRGYVNGVKYRFDIVLETENSGELVLVEVQGSSHRLPEVKKVDADKAAFAECEGIPLIQISVGEENRTACDKVDSAVVANRPKRRRKLPAKYSDSCSSLDAVACEVINEVRSGCHKSHTFVVDM